MEKAIGGLDIYVPSKSESFMSRNIEKPRPDQGEWEGGSTTCPDRTLEKRRSFLAKLAKRLAEDLAKDSRDQQWKFEPMKFPEVREDAPLIVHVKYQEGEGKGKAEEEDDDDDEEEDEHEDDLEVSDQNEIRWIYEADLELFYDNPKAVRFLDKLYRAMRNDNRSRFVKLIQREITVGTVRRSGIIFDPSLLLFMAINLNAVLIAKSILDGSAGLGISDLDAFDPPPAFAAARRFLPEMINELDFYGARFDIPCRFYSSGYYLMVPFEAAIKELGDKISWSLDQSLDVLIHSLCGNLNLELETISLLMGKTPVDRIKNVIFEYTRKLNVVGLTVLLYVDSTSGHLGLLKEFSAEVYSSLVKAAGDPCTELDYDVIDYEQEALDAVKRSLEFFRTGNFEEQYGMEKAIGGLDEYVPSKSESRMSENIEKPRPDQGEWEDRSTTCPDRTLEKRRSFLAKLAKRFAKDLAKDSRDQPWKFEAMKFPEVREDAPLIVHVKYQEREREREGEKEKEKEQDEDEDEDEDGHEDSHQNEIRCIYEADRKLYYHNLKAVRFISKLYQAMRYDNRSRFVKLIQREIAVGTVRRSGIIFHPSLLLFMAINSKAVLIAKSILDRSAGLEVSDLDEAPNAFDPPPAFAAARRFLPEMVNELDIYGARFDIPSRFYSSGYYLMVPFEAAIKELGDTISWSLDQSLDVLIHSLCGNLNLELETISLLMGKTQVDRIKNVIFEYTGKLNVVGLTVLLYVDSTSGHLGLLKEFSAEVYSSLVKAAGDPCTELDYDVIDYEQEALDAVKRSLEFFRTGNFEVRFSFDQALIAKRIRGVVCTDDSNVGDFHGAN